MLFHPEKKMSFDSKALAVELRLSRISIHINGDIDRYIHSFI